MSSLLSLQNRCFKRALLCCWSQQLLVMSHHLWAPAPQGWAAVGHDHNAKDTHLLHLVDRKEPGTESLEGKRVRMRQGQPPPPPR